jgi:threonylcarbamoyladenosine tRNA methylthiotransferase MtaB
MGRPYTAAEYEERARAFLSRVPKAAVGADVMVGFPGEGEAAFRRTVGLLGRLLPLRVHVFPFSPRPGTPAAGMAGQVSPGVKARRAAELRALALGWSQQAYRRFWGQPMRVLLEERKGGLWWGHAENYARVGVPQSGAVRGKIVTARLFRVEEGCALGVITNSSEDLRYTA